MASVLHPDPDIAGPGLKMLACAVIAQAVQEARAGDQEAMTWLQREGPMWCDGLGYDLTPEVLADLIRRTSTRRSRRAVSTALRMDLQVPTRAHRKP